MTKSAMADEKRCGICGEFFSLAEFAYGKDKKRPYCLKCANKSRTIYTNKGDKAGHEWLRQMRGKWK